MGGTADETNTVSDVTLGAFYDNPGSFYSGFSMSQSINVHFNLPIVLAKPATVPHFYFEGGIYSAKPGLSACTFISHKNRYGFHAN